MIKIWNAFKLRYVTNISFIDQIKQVVLPKMF